MKVRSLLPSESIERRECIELDLGKASSFSKTNGPEFGSRQGLKKFVRTGELRQHRPVVI